MYRKYWTAATTKNETHNSYPDMKRAWRLYRALRRKVLGVPAGEQTLESFYLDYLRYATPGMCVPGNIYLFDKVICGLESSLPILEIGSWCGQSANILSYLLSKYHKSNQLFTCDGWRYENTQHPEKLGESEITFDEYYDFVKATFVRNTDFFSKNRLPHSVHLVSDDFFDAWRADKCVVDVFGRNAKLGGQFSLCFIDGDHSYEAVRRDFENCDAFLPPGGQILFDDSAEGSGWNGVQKIVAEVINDGGYEVIMRNPNVLMRKRGTVPA